MQSYLKYKEYYGRKAKAALLLPGYFCFILQPLADHQGSKIPFREFRWIGPYVIEKVLPNDNYIVRNFISNKTQILHRIRLRKYTPNYKTFVPKEIYKLMMKLLFHRMIFTLFHGTPISMNFLIVLNHRPFPIIVMNKTL